MVVFSRALVESGKSVPAGKVVYIPHLLPSKIFLTSGIQCIARITRKMFKKDSLETVLSIGGGVTSDGFK